MSSAKEILEKNAALFAERDRVLRQKAKQNPYRHPPNKRTWQDWAEIHNAVHDSDRNADEGRMWLKALRLAPSLDVFEALLRGESVPRSRLDPDWAKAYGY